LIAIRDAYNLHRAFRTFFVTPEAYHLLKGEVESLNLRADIHDGWYYDYAIKTKAPKQIWQA
jgi:hypothetical protein